MSGHSVIFTLARYFLVRLTQQAAALSTIDTSHYKLIKQQLDART